MRLTYTLCLLEGLGLSRRVLVRVKIIRCGYILCALLLFSICHCYAMTLGEIEVISHLNEPLQARVFIDGGSDIKSDLKVFVAGRESYQRANLTPPSWLDKVNVKVATDMKGAPQIEISTSDPVVDLFAHLLIQVKWSDNLLTKHFTLLLDPLTPNKIAVIDPHIEKTKDKENREMDKKILKKLGELEKQVNTLTKVNQDVSKKYEALKTQHDKLLLQVNRVASAEIQSNNTRNVIEVPCPKTNPPDLTKQIHHLTPHALLALMQNNYLHLSFHFFKSQIKD